MSPGRGDDAGFTLLELLISMVLSIMLIGVLGTSLVVGLRGARATTETVENSADAQAMSNYLPQDIQSAAGPSAVTTAASDLPGCADDALATGQSVVRLRWSGDGATPSLSYAADYRIAQDPSAGGNQPDRWRLTRYACTTSPTPANASVTIVARNLVGPPATPTVTATGLTLVLTDIQTDGSTYVFSVSASFRTAAAVGTASPTPAPSPSPTASATAAPSPTASPTTSPLPAVVSLVNAAMRDTPDPVSGLGDGKIDQIRLNFSAAPQAVCDSGWSVAGLPPGYSLTTGQAVITANSTSATIAVTPGTNAATAAVGANLTFAPPAGCTIIAVLALGLTDEAAPALVSVKSTNATGHAPGQIEAGDVLSLTFSESITAPASSGLITETSGNSPAFDTLSIAGVTTNATLGSNNYVGNNATVTAPGSFSDPDTTGHTILAVTVGTLTNGNRANAGSGVLVLTLSTGIVDRAAIPNAVIARPWTSVNSIQVF